MKKPGPIVYLFGNPAVVIALFGATVYFAYRWWAQGASFWPPLLALLAASYGTRASDQLGKYHRWNLEWQNMEGSAPRSVNARWTPATRSFIAAGILATIFLVILANANSADMRIAASLVGVASMIAAITGFVRTRSMHATPVVARRSVLVTVCVPKLRQQATLAEARAAVPRYCGTLLGR